MYGGLQSLICFLAKPQIPKSMQQNLDQYKNCVKGEGGISKVEIPDRWDAVSYGDDRGNSQAGFRIQDDSEGQNEKSWDVKKNSYFFLW